MGEVDNEGHLLCVAALAATVGTRDYLCESSRYWNIDFELSECFRNACLMGDESATVMICMSQCLGTSPGRAFCVCS